MIAAICRTAMSRISERGLADALGDFLADQAVADRQQHQAERDPVHRPGVAGGAEVGDDRGDGVDHRLRARRAGG